MSAATIDGATVCSVSEARKRLMNTRGMGDAEINDLQAIIARFQEARPRNKQCVACGCCVFKEGIDTYGASVWCCAGCRRPASLTSQQWFAQNKAQQQASEARQAAADAAAPKPRQRLRTALATLAEARSTVAQLEAALPAARAAVAAAQTRYDAAQTAADEAPAAAAESLATSFFTGKSSGTVPSAAAARAELAAATEDLVVK